MQYPVVTASVAAAFAIMLVLLSFQVSLRRKSLALTHGDGGDEILKRRVRAHGNFVENAPLAVIVLGLVELSGVVHAVTIALAVAFVASRVLHAAGMLFTNGPALRAAAMVIQHLSFLAAAAVLLKCLLGLTQ